MILLAAKKKEKNQQKVKHADVNVVSMTIGSCHQLSPTDGDKAWGELPSAPEMKLLISTGITIVHCILLSLENDLWQVTLEMLYITIWVT